MTQEEQTALVDGQQQAAATNAADTEPKKDHESQVNQDENNDTPDQAKGGQAQEGQTQMRALFKQIIRMRSVRKLSPAAKAAKAARQAAKAAANAAKAAEIAARAADNAALAAQVAAQAALEENAKVDEKKAAPVPEKPAEEAKSEETGKQEEVAAK